MVTLVLAGDGLNTMVRGGAAAAHETHNLEVEGSNPSPATISDV